MALLPFLADFFVRRIVKRQENKRIVVLEFFLKAKYNDVG